MFEEKLKFYISLLLLIYINMVIVNHSGTINYFEVEAKVCFQLEAKLNASRYVDRWSDLGDKLYQAGLGNLDLISVPEHQYLFLKTALTSPPPRREEVKPLRKVAFDEMEMPSTYRRPEPKFTWMTGETSRPEPKFTWMTSETSKPTATRHIPRYELGSRVVGFMVLTGK